MAQLMLSDILNDLQAAEAGLHRFERRYWISSDHFYELYSQGLLDDGENLTDFSEWAGHYKLRQKRQSALDQISAIRVETLREQSIGESIQLIPAEPVLELK
jgi:hypothetical protein